MLISCRLNNLESVLGNSGISALDKKNVVRFAQILTGCRNVLETLKKELGSFDSLGTTSEERWKRFVHRFKWDQKKISELRDQIISNITLLNTFSLEHIRYLPGYHEKWCIILTQPTSSIVTD